MAKNRTIQRNTGKKKGRPIIRFNFGILLLIFVLSFASCFILYMAAANLNEDFLDDDSKTVAVKNEEPADEPENDDEQADVGEAAPPPPANPIPESEAVDSSYFDNCCLATDSTLLDMGSYTDMTDIIGSDALNAASCNNISIESSYGTITVYQTMQIKKPSSLYLMLGSDIGTSTIDDMIVNYTTLINNLHNSIPEMKIYIMQYPPVFADSETVTNEMINDYNSRLLALARNASVYCIDTNTALKSAEGTLSAEYWNAEKGTFTEDAYKAIADYIRTHTV